MPTATTTDPTAAGTPASTQPTVAAPGPRRWKVALVLAAIFACGVLVGALGTLRATRPGGRHRPPDPARWTAMVMDRLDARLHFTAAQRARVTPLIRAGAEEAREARRRAYAETRGIIDRAHTQIAAELTDGQRQELERIIAERRVRARRWLGPAPDGGDEATPKRP